jgi:hypothetical protein
MAVYVAVTDGRGKVPIILQLVDAEEEDAPLFRGEVEAEFRDPRIIVELDFHIGGLTFPKAGEYRFQLFAGRDFLIERRLLVAPVVETKR